MRFEDRNVSVEDVINAVADSPLLDFQYWDGVPSHESERLRKPRNRPKSGIIMPDRSRRARFVQSRVDFGANYEAGQVFSLDDAKEHVFELLGMPSHRFDENIFFLWRYDCLTEGGDVELTDACYHGVVSHWDASRDFQLFSKAAGDLVYRSLPEMGWLTRFNAIVEVTPNERTFTWLCTEANVYSLDFHGVVGGAYKGRDEQAAMERESLTKDRIEYLRENLPLIKKVSQEFTHKIEGNLLKVYQVSDLWYSVRQYRPTPN